MSPFGTQMNSIKLLTAVTSRFATLTTANTKITLRSEVKVIFGVFWPYFYLKLCVNRIVSEASDKKERN